MGERRVDLERLARLQDLLLLRQGGQRAHVVQAVGELDQDDPHVGGHRHHHLPVVLGLALVAALERDPGQLRDAVDEVGDGLAELRLDLVDRGGRVLDGVVQERRAERVRVEPQPGADLRHLDRVADEVLARAPLLVGVAVAGEDEGALEHRPVDLLVGRLRVLGDDREQVAEQSALALAEAAGELVGGERLVATLLAADPDVAVDLEIGDLGARGRALVAVRDGVTLEGDQLAVLLRRNSRPSSYRAVEARQTPDRSSSVLSEDRTRNKRSSPSGPPVAPISQIPSSTRTRTQRAASAASRRRPGAPASNVASASPASGSAAAPR